MITEYAVVAPGAVAVCMNTAWTIMVVFALIAYVTLPFGVVLAQ